MDSSNGVVGGERMNRGLSQACRSCENTTPHTQRLGPIPTSCVLRSSLSPLSWYCVSGPLSSRPLVSPRGQTCEPHMVCRNCCLWEHACACPDFIRGIKERGGRNQNIMMIAKPENRLSSHSMDRCSVCWGNAASTTKCLLQTHTEYTVQRERKCSFGPATRPSIKHSSLPWMTYSTSLTSDVLFKRKATSHDVKSGELGRRIFGRPKRQVRHEPLDEANS